MFRYISFAVLVLVVLVYIDWHIRNIFSFYSIGKYKRFSIFFRILLFLASFVLIALYPPGVMIVLHFLGVFLVSDMIAFLIKRVRFHKQFTRGYRCIQFLCYGGIMQILIVITMLGYGYYNISYIKRTEYTIQTSKVSSDYQMVFISDTHYGTVQNPAVLKNAVEEIKDLEPDIVVLGGDIVEGGTSREEMEEVFQMIGAIECRHGIYYVYGNHDRQQDSEQRTYTDEELEKAITKNGITILKDNYVEIGSDLILAGRDDAEFGEEFRRLPAEKILNAADKERYIIMLDHQPVETAMNSKAGVDLQLSGHTHAGQAFPAGQLLHFIGIPYYGEYQILDCKLLVSSGASVGVFPIRTEKHCEYALIDIKQNGTAN